MINGIKTIGSLYGIVYIFYYLKTSPLDGYRIDVRRLHIRTAKPSIQRVTESIQTDKASIFRVQRSIKRVKRSGQMDQTFWFSAGGFRNIVKLFGQIVKFYVYRVMPLSWIVKALARELIIAHIQFISVYNTRTRYISVQWFIKLFKKDFLSKSLSVPCTEFRSLSRQVNFL